MGNTIHVLLLLLLPCHNNISSYRDARRHVCAYLNMFILYGQHMFRSDRTIRGCINNKMQVDV